MWGSLRLRSGYGHQRIFQCVKVLRLKFEVHSFLYLADVASSTTTTQCTETGTTHHYTKVLWMRLRQIMVAMLYNFQRCVVVVWNCNRLGHSIEPKQCMIIGKGRQHCMHTPSKQGFLPWSLMLNKCVPIWGRQPRVTRVSTWPQSKT